MWRAGLGATLGTILALALAVIAAPGAFGEDNSTQVADACQAVTTLELKVKSEGENAPSGEPGGGFKGAVARIGKSISDLEKEGDQEGFVRISVRPKLAKLADGSYRVTLEIVQKAIPARLSEADRNKVAVILAALAGWSHTIPANDKSAEADGSRTIRLHGPFKALAEAGVPGADSLAIKVCLPLPPQILNCTSISLSYEPASIIHPRSATPQVSYLPAGCRQPSGNTKYELVEQAGGNGENQVAALSLDGRVWAALDMDGSVTVEVSHGELSASAAVAVVKRAKCDEMRIFASSIMSVGEWESVLTRFSPEDCAAPSDSELVYLTGSPQIADFDKSAEGLPNYLYAIKEGNASISVHWEKGSLTGRAEITVGKGKQDCETLEMKYPSPLTVGAATGLKPTGVSPQLRYRPLGCKVPSDHPVFTAFNPDIVSVGGATGTATGTKAGTARIGAKQGDRLFAVATVEVVNLPDCDSVILSYGTMPLVLRNSADPEIHYSTRGSFPQHLCKQPAKAFASDDRRVVAISDTGRVTGLAMGSAWVSLTHPDNPRLSARTKVQVAGGEPCNSLSASYSPRLIAEGKLATLSVSYRPEHCVPPEDALIAGKGSGDGEVDFDGVGNATGRRPGSLVVEVRSGQLKSNAFLYVHGSCDDFTEDAGPAIINATEATQLTVTPQPKDCTSSPELIRVSSEGTGLSIEPLGSGQFRVKGVHGGVWNVTATAPAFWGANSAPIVKSVSIKVEAPDCTSIRLSYAPDRLHRNIGQAEPDIAQPSIIYLPDGCTRPSGNLVFTSDAGNFHVDREGRVSIHARAENDTSSNATITLKHGALSGEAKVYLAE